MEVVLVERTPTAQQVDSCNSYATSTIDESDMRDGNYYFIVKAHFDWAMHHACKGNWAVSWLVVMAVIAIFCQLII
jgi:hypothetical protein